MAAALGLGTAQFGMNYGISNSVGQTPEAEVARIMSLAWDSGCRVLDTAAGYGDSEAVLGRLFDESRPFRIVTKTPAAAGNGGGPKIGRAFSEQLARLRRRQIYGLLVHRTSDLLGPFGAELYRELCALKDMGLVERIGASVYDGAEIDALLDRFDLDLVQLPVNVFDQRLVENSRLSLLKDRGVEVHVRSAFLQGVLLLKPDELPEFLRPLAESLREFRGAAGARGMSPLQAALSFVKGLDGVDVVLVGVTQYAELEEIVAAFSGTQSFDAAAFACGDARLVNPSLWPQ